MKIIALLPDEGKEKYGLQPTLSYPDSSIVKNGNPLFIPDFDSSFSGRVFMAVKISRLGKNIAERFVCRYFSEIAPAIAVFADNLLNALRHDGMPWTIATGFDKSLVLGKFIPYNDNEPGKTFQMILEDSSQTRIAVPLPEMNEIEKAVSEVSRYNSLKMGDLILIPVKVEPFILSLDSLVTIREGEDVLLKLPVR